LVSQIKTCLYFAAETKEKIYRKKSFSWKLPNISLPLNQTAHLRDWCESEMPLCKWRLTRNNIQSLVFKFITIGKSILSTAQVGDCMV